MSAHGVGGREVGVAQGTSPMGRKHEPVKVWGLLGNRDAQQPGRWYTALVCSGKAVVHGEPALRRTEHGGGDMPIAARWSARRLVERKTSFSPSRPESSSSNSTEDSWFAIDWRSCALFWRASPVRGGEYLPRGFSSISADSWFAMVWHADRGVVLQASGSPPESGPRMGSDVEGDVGSDICWARRSISLPTVKLSEYDDAEKGSEVANGPGSAAGRKGGYGDWTSELAGDWSNEPAGEGASAGEWSGVESSDGDGSMEGVRDGVKGGVRFGDWGGESMVERAVGEEACHAETNAR